MREVKYDSNVSVRVPQETYTALKTMAKINGLSMADYVRYIFKYWLENHNMTTEEK